ncbi:MAG: pitrilysin family protein [Planctomycetaceae bacterium]
MTTTQAAQTFQLDCGATLLVQPMPDVQSASVAILVPAGVIHEPSRVNGAASVLGDLVMRGAGQYDSRQLSSAFDRLGVQRNESTSWSFTSLSASMLAEHLPTTLPLYAAVLRESHLPEDELQPAIDGVEHSLRAMEDEPHRKVFVELRRSTYDDPWGRPSEGTLDDLANIDLPMLREFYAQGFRPNGTIIGVAGNVDPSAVRDQLDSLLCGWSSAVAASPSPSPRQPPRRHIPHDSTQTHIALSWNAVPYGHPDYYRAWVACNVLGGNSSSRLFTQVRERRGLCYSVSTSLSFAADEGRVLGYVGTTTERAQETLDVTLEEIQRLAEGVNADELARCQAHAKSSLVMSQESSGARASSIARDWHHLGRVQTLDEIHEKVASVTVEE